MVSSKESLNPSKNAILTSTICPDKPWHNFIFFHQFQIVRSNNKWVVIGWTNEKPYYIPTEAIRTAMNAETKWLQFVISIDMPCEIWAGASLYTLRWSLRPDLLSTPAGSNDLIITLTVWRLTTSLSERKFWCMYL